MTKNKTKVPTDTPAQESTCPDPIPGTTSQPTNTVKAFAVVPDLRNAILVYLGTKPLNEVENIVSGLRQAPEINVVVTDAQPN